MRISDWSSDVCSSDLAGGVGDAPDATVRRDFQAAAVIGQIVGHLEGTIGLLLCEQPRQIRFVDRGVGRRESESAHQDAGQHAGIVAEGDFRRRLFSRSEEHTSELQSLMRISYAVFCLKKKTQPIPPTKLLSYINLPITIYLL